MPYVLDTDTITALQHNHAAVVARVRSVAPVDLFVTVVSLEEQGAGRLHVLGGTVMLRLRQISDDSAVLQQSFDGFERWQAVRAVFQGLAFATGLWSLLAAAQNENAAVSRRAAR